MNEANDKSKALDSAMVRITTVSAAEDQLRPIGKVHAVAVGPIEPLRGLYVWARDFLEKRKANPSIMTRIVAAIFEAIPTETKWSDVVPNLVTTVGKNSMLDNHWAGSGYTATWYGGLIALSGYSALAAADTMSSHAGWTEDQNYSAGTRPSASWSTAASGGSKSLTSNMSYSINASTTIKGVFFASNSTKGGTTGTLCSEALFSGGDKAVNNGDTLNVGYTSTLT